METPERGLGRRALVAPGLARTAPPWELDEMLHSDRRSAFLPARKPLRRRAFTLKTLADCLGWSTAGGGFRGIIVFGRPRILRTIQWMRRNTQIGINSNSGFLLRCARNYPIYGQSSRPHAKASDDRLLL